MKRRIFLSIVLCLVLALPVRADTIKWVDFQVPYESLKYALDRDVATFEQEKHLSWIDILALAACRTGGKCGLSSVKKRRRICLLTSRRKSFWADFINTMTIITDLLMRLWVVL